MRFGQCDFSKNQITYKQSNQFFSELLKQIPFLSEQVFLLEHFA
jgi:hypothetical protein